MKNKVLACACLAGALLTANGFSRSAPLVLASSPDPRAPLQSLMVTAAGRACSAGYQAADWTGWLRCWRIDPATALTAETPDWDSSVKLDAPGVLADSRTVFSHDGMGGIPFRWENLSSAQRAALKGTDADPAGRMRVDFLRGDHSGETLQRGSLRDRRRQADKTLFRQADVVHSQPWFTGRPARSALPAALGERSGMLYVGGNDGMLHGFDAATGIERLAYVPRGVIPQLRAWAQPASPHRYLVDGQVFSGEADIRTLGSVSAWSTVLVGSAGAGAPGFFILDVSRPDGLTEASAGSIVLADTSDGADPDIGHITADAATDAAGSQSTQIVQLNDGRWAVLMGNGVNSRNEMPVLLVQYLDKDRELRKIVPPCPEQPCSHSGSNGLATPLAIDLDGDGKVDVAYAGDLLGNVWKFDIGAEKPAGWTTALDGKPLFTARDAFGVRQPIVSPPTWLPHPLGGVMLGLGTGRDLTVEDRDDTRVQTLYGLYDQNRVFDPDTLVAQVLLPGTRSIDGHEYSRTSANAVDYLTRPAPGGWYLNMPAKGEKLLHAPRPFAGQKVMFFSGTADHDYLNVLNLFNGQPSTRPVFTALVDPTIATPPTENASRLAMPRRAVRLVNQPRQWLLTSPGQKTVVLDKGNGPGIRAGWRQLQ